MELEKITPAWVSNPSSSPTWPRRSNGFKECRNVSVTRCALRKKNGRDIPVKEKNRRPVDASQEFEILVCDSRFPSDYKVRRDLEEFEALSQKVRRAGAEILGHRLGGKARSQDRFRYPGLPIGQLAQGGGGEVPLSPRFGREHSVLVSNRPLRSNSLHQTSSMFLDSRVIRAAIWVHWCRRCPLVTRGAQDSSGGSTRFSTRKCSQISALFQTHNTPEQTQVIDSGDFICIINNTTFNQAHPFSTLC